MTLKPIRIISKNIDENGGGEEAILLSPITRMFHEPGYKFYILAIMGWKVPIDVDSIKAELQRKMLKHPRFSSLQVMDKLSHDGKGEMRWVPTTVNIDDHIILPQIAHNNMDDADKPSIDIPCTNMFRTSHFMPSAQLTFVVAVDEGLLIPDPSQLGDDFVDSFMLIKEVALTKLRTNTDV
ncbi:putative clustered mitochondria protein -like protein isoform X1 [Capsicum annuum]|nr:putative clustered mitochondria protein -like protein isoform X1 [Capsicum annuum]